MLLSPSGFASLNGLAMQKDVADLVMEALKVLDEKEKQRLTEGDTGEQVSTLPDSCPIM